MLVVLEQKFQSENTQQIFFFETYLVGNVDVLEMVAKQINSNTNSNFPRIDRIVTDVYTW